MSVADSVPDRQARRHDHLRQHSTRRSRTASGTRSPRARRRATRSTGIAYPLADADIAFDSGELGVTGPPTAGRLTWSTPTDLPDGTYTYFCRIHPFMRGAFRVEVLPASSRQARTFGLAGLVRGARRGRGGAGGSSSATTRPGAGAATATRAVTRWPGDRPTARGR